MDVNLFIKNTLFTADIHFAKKVASCSEYFRYWK